MSQAAEKVTPEVTDEQKPAVSITKKIVGYGVVKPGDEKADSGDKKECCGGDCSCKKDEEQSVRIGLTENMKRPEILMGTTYKMKSPTCEHALYMTVNDYTLEDGTRVPYELFLNSKNMDHFQWVAGMTRVISAVFRKGGDVTFLAEELQEVFDPRGGWFMKGGKYCPSIVALIGMKLEEHFKFIGLIEVEEMSEHQKAILEEKRQQFEAQQAGASGDAKAEESTGDFPEGSQLCPKCNTKAMIQMDGCMTCLNCGDSKCS